MSHSSENGGASYGSVKTYMTDLILPIILTVIPLWTVMTGSISSTVVLGIILAMTVIQTLVHLVYFLRINSKSGEG